MSKSLLLHSLSLKDRILEPNKLPLNGQVWAYNKEEHSKEEFVGNCITMLSLLGMQNASIQWKEDILAFDTQWENRTYTIIISLQDDSLASEHYYFLGIWETPDNEKANQHRFASSKPWEDEDLLKPDISYSVTVSSEPMQIPEIRKELGSELFGQSIYGGDYYLCGTTYPGSSYSGKFIITPLENRFNHARHNIKHALYSLRNLMALMGKAIAIHDATLSDEMFESFKKNQLELAKSTVATDLSPAECGKLASQYGESLLKACELLDHYDRDHKQLQSIKLLFDAITTELAAEESSAFRPLFHRMRLPFKHATTLLQEHSDATLRIEKQVQILQQTLHSRMLADQLVAIESWTNQIKKV
jgi:hypothetical protein